MKMYDELTGLYNREGFIEKVEESLVHSEKHDYQIIRFDIKNFKFVNSIFGRESGDMLLSEIGDTLKEHGYPEEICGRLDSDRFAVFVRSQYSQNLVSLISDTEFRVVDNDTYPIHICIGIYKIRDEDESVSEMCDRAGLALGTIKENLMEKIAVYEDSMYDKLMQEHQLSLDLPAAIENDQLKLYLQPQIDINGGVVGAEALVRWQHPQRGLLMPAEFVPLFERNYMIVEMDRYIWEKSCQQLRRWADEGREKLYISINVSPRDFECIDVYDVLLGLVNKYRLNLDQLKVEITESTIMQNPMHQIQLIGRLRAAGFYVEMDDFGNGYSSISMLKDIEIDAIKLDMRFLSKTVHTDRACKILKSITQLIRDFNMVVIAEGVENIKQVEFLKDIGCDMFQGFFFSEPLPVDDFEKKMWYRG
jgi:diguanylate cyclase (GGDEF)-like protein